MAAPPTFDSTAPATITLTIGETYEVLLPPATDPDGGVLTYTLEPKTASGDNADPGLLTIGFNFAPNTRLLTATADLPTGSLTGESGTYVYTASAAAVGAETDAETVTHEIAITVNSSVSFAGATISDMKWKVGRDIEVRLPQATDSRTRSVVAYSIDPTLPIGMNFDTALRYITGSPNAAAPEAEYTYIAVGTVGGDAEARDEIKFKITAAVDSDPVFGPESVGNITGTVGTAITRVQLPTATDADGDTVTHRLTPDLPAGLTFDDTLFIIEGTPTAAMAETEYTWAATDADGLMTGGTAAEKKFNITINATPVPVAFATGASIADEEFVVGTFKGIVLPPAAADTGTGDLTYSLTPARPDGLTFTAATRTLSGTATAAAAAAEYTYTVTDSATPATTATLTFNITVVDPSAPVPVDPNTLRFAPGTEIADMTFTAGTAIGTTAMPYIELPRAYGGPTGVYTYSLLKGIGKVDVTDGDNGLSVDRTNLRLMGTPTAEAASTIYTWRVTDAQAHGDIEDSVELEFNITVGAAPIITPTNVAPVVTITTPQPPAGAIIFRPSFTIAYTATDENVGDTVTVEASHSVAPSNAAASYTVTHDATAKTVTVTQAQPAPVAVVTITVTGTDTGGLMGSDSIELSFGPRGGPAPPDTAPPVLTSHSFVVTNISQLTLTLVFNEPVNAETIDIDDHNGNGVSQAGPAAGTATNSYTVLVNAPGHATRAKTYMSLESGLADMLGNATTADQVLTYTTPTVPAPTVAISGPDALNCDIGDQITLTVTGTTETLVKGDITISAGWTMGDDSDPSDGTFDLVPDGNKAIGVTTVKVDVKANAVGANAAVSKTFTVGPVLTIPAGGYIVVIRPEHRFSTHLRDPLYLGSVGVRGLPVDIQYWECMPDLTVFFGRSGAGIGGGALVVKQSPDHTGAAIGKGSVGISEIMWASDEGTIHGLTSNTNQAREQWIELHNLNGHEVKVTLVARPTTYALTNEGAAEIDRMSNFEVGNSWVVKGQNGDSALGKDFVSMYRHKNNNNYAHGDNNGKNGGKWNASTLVYRTKQSVLAGRGATNPVHSFKGTPGRSNTISPAGPPVRTNVPNSPVVINEVANRRDQTLEWIELKNVSDGEVNLRNYHLSLVTGVNSERAFYTFPNNDNTKIPAKGLLLLVDTDPRYNDDHPVAVGRNIHTGNDQALGIGADAPRYMVTDFAEGGLPDNGEFVLMLRRPDGHDKAGTAENKRGTEKNMIDAVGYHPNLKSTGEPLYTNLWPLRVFGAPNDKNKIAGETVHYRQHAGRDPDEVPGNKVENAALRDADYTGVGYKRHTPGDAAHGGSPGYEHGTQKNLASEVSGTGLVTISEIMFDQGDGRYPQWIELYNSSPTQPVNLRGGKTGWKLVIENYDDGEIPINRLTGTLNFRNTGVGGVHTILPQQTVIVASTRARNSGSAFFDTAVVFPPTRVFSVWDDARGALDMKRSTDPILSTEGFYIELIDGGNDANPNGYVSDSVGNLTDSPNRRVAAEKAWELSDITGEMMDDMGRSSILRRYRKAEKGKDPRTWAKYTAAELMDLGIMAEGWVAAHKTDFREVRETWFGHPDDYGSPGITGGRVLPVSLSKFRPERLEDGTVAIRWLTESETNNAGFNILRSEERRGEFTKLNTQLIAGQGTTSERTNYEFADKSAKPNVVYYYQIQDVSLDGEVSILQITHLRGHVSAAGKATTTWGELKALQ
jgi:hypothetical protein